MKTQINEMRIQTFLNALGSNSPAPGGGAAAGLSGALGAALGKMVAELTVGKQKYAAFSDHAQAVSDRLSLLMDRFALLADTDAAAYSGYMDALALPKETEAQKTERRAALQEAVHRATDVPCRVIEACGETVDLLASLHRCSNPTCAGDLAAGAAEIETAAKIAWLNVLANLPYFSDRTEAERIQADFRAMLSDLCGRCGALYREIASSLEAK